MNLQQKFPQLDQYKKELLSKTNRTPEEDFLLKNLEASMQNYQKKWEGLKKKYNFNDEYIQDIIDYAENQDEAQRLILAIQSVAEKNSKTLKDRPNTLQICLRMAQNDQLNKNLRKEMKRFEREAEQLNIAQFQCVRPNYKKIKDCSKLKVDLARNILIDSNVHRFKKATFESMNLAIYCYKMQCELINPSGNVSKVFRAIANYYRELSRGDEDNRVEEKNKAIFYEKMFKKAELMEFQLGLINPKKELNKGKFDPDNIENPQLKQAQEDLYNDVLTWILLYESGRRNIFLIFSFFEKMEKIHNTYHDEIQDCMANHSGVIHGKNSYVWNAARVMFQPGLFNMFLDAQKADANFPKDDDLTYLLKTKEGDWKWIQAHEQKNRDEWIDILKEFNLGNRKHRARYAEYLLLRDEELRETTKGSQLYFKEREIPIRQFYTDKKQIKDWPQRVFSGEPSDLNQKEDQPEDQPEETTAKGNQGCEKTIDSNRPAQPQVQRQKVEDLIGYVRTH